jgi:hypothetical protein
MANGVSTQQFTPAEFAAKIKAKYPAYKSIPDDQLVSKITAKYPQYKSQIKGGGISASDPLVTGKMPMPIAPVPTPPTPTEPRGTSSYGKAGPRGEQPLFTSAEARKQVGNELALGGSLIGGEAVEGSGLLMKMLAQFLGGGVGKASGGIATGQKPTMRDVKEGLETGGSFAATEGILGGGGKLISSIPRILRGPGMEGEIEAPLPAMIRRELESRIPRNEPVGVREQMYKDLAERQDAMRKLNEAKIADVKKSHADFESKLKGIEDARQKELAGLERLKEQDAQAKIRRGEEQGSIDTEAETKTKKAHAEFESKLREIEEARQKELADIEKLKEQHASSIEGREGEPPKVEPLVRINKLLGVTPREIRVGQVPESLDAFASNPARAIQKFGISPDQLAKMSPLERLKSVTQLRDSVGAQLDQVLKSSDKTVNLQKPIEEIFKQIPDKDMSRNAATRFLQIYNKGVFKPLDNMTPFEARQLQRALDDYANFAPEGALKTFRDVATALRRVISKATRQAVPESSELDMDYGDLAGAVKASRKQVGKFAVTPPKGSMVSAVPF